MIGNNFEGELPQTGNTFQWTDNYTKTFGKHTVKFGGDVRRQRFDQFLYFEVSGNYSFTNQSNVDQILGNDAYPNYFLGAANSYQQGSAQGENVRNSALYLFAQDSYKLTNTVTLNYGLRWELNTPYYDLGNRLQTFRPGQATTQYPCWLSTTNATALGLAPGDCGRTAAPTTPSFHSAWPFQVIKVFRAAYLHLLQILRSAHWNCVESRGHRRPARENYWRPGQDQYSCRLRNFLQSDRTVGSRTVQRGTALRRQHISFGHAFQPAVRISSRRQRSESLHRGDQSNASDTLRRRAGRRTERLRGLVFVPSHSSLRRISAAPEIPIFRPIQPHD